MTPGRTTPSVGRVYRGSVPLLDVDGARVHYAEAGAAAPAGGDPLVLLHAFPLHSEMWAPQLACLSSGRRVIAPDLKGFGASEAPTGPARGTMLDYAEELAAFLDALGIERVVLGGLSMGGYVAFAFLRRHADRVTGLILADTRAAADTTEVFERRTDQQDRVAEEGTTALVEVLLGGLLCDNTKAHRLELVDHVRRLMANPAAGYIAALEAMKHRPDATAELAAIGVPVLVLVGEHDALSSPAVAREMAGAIPDAQLAVLANAGHLSNLEAPDEFNAAVADFLERL